MASKDPVKRSEANKRWWRNNKTAIIERRKSHNVDIETKACVDHNHTTGKIRQIVCNNCNAVLGYAREQVSVLQAAIEYLDKHQ